MHRKKLLDELLRYSALPHFTLEEKLTLKKFFEFIENEKNCFERSNIGHITASAWSVSLDKKKVLLTLHKRFNSWYQLGGHADGDNDCSRVALKEAMEESGISNLNFITKDIFDIDIHSVPSSCKYHYDVRYLLIASSDEPYRISEESNDLSWVPFNKLYEYSNSESMNRMNEKFKKYFI